MKLAEYLASKDISVPDFADMVNVERQSVHRWLKNERVPDALRLAKIAEVTGGAVTPNDFFELAVLATEGPVQ